MKPRVGRESTRQFMSMFNSGSKNPSRMTSMQGTQCLLNLGVTSRATRASFTKRFALSRGLVSWTGTSFKDEASNRYLATSEVFSRNANGSNGHLFLSPPCRTMSTSSASSPSLSKKEDENNDDVESGNSSTDLAKPVSAEDTSFKSMMKRYGKVFISTYFVVYVSTVLGLFSSLQSGQLDAIYIISLLTGTSSPAEPGGVADPETIKEAASAMKDLVELLESYTLTRPVAPMVEEYPWTANFAIAWIATKFTEPIRFGATVVMTPPIARFFGFKPTPTAVKNGPIDVVSKKDNLASDSDSAKS